MKLIQFLILLFLISLPGYTFAETYPAIWSCNPGYTLTSDPVPGACHNNNNYNYWVYGYAQCPGGGSFNNGQCVNAPDCSSGEVRSTTTGLCGVPPPHVCVIPEDPTKSNCYFPEGTEDGLNCTDGSTVYPPMVCPYSLWDSFFPPGPGESQTCRDGFVATYPSSCFDHWKITDAENPFGMQKAVGIVLSTLGGGLGPKPVLRVAGTLNDGLPSIRAVLPLEAKINQAGTSAYASIDTSLSKISIGKAVSEYIKSAPTSSYATALTTAAVAVGGMALVIDSNTGSVTPVGSSVPLTSNQIGDLALSTNSTNAIPLTEIEPFVDYGLSPWIEPAIDAIDVDFKRVYDPDGSKSALNFPSIESGTSSPYISPSYNSDISPIATLDSNSPSEYTAEPESDTSTQPDPTQNPNPDGTDAQTTPYTEPDPNTQIDPTSTESPPDPPTIYPDTWKYFDWLPMENPLLFDPLAYLPSLPEPTCYYEVHSSFNVPFLGTKHLDVAPCVPLQPLRAVLAWVFSILTIFACFFVIFRSNF